MNSTLTIPFDSDETRQAFAECKPGEKLTLEVTVTEKTDQALTASLDGVEYGETEEPAETPEAPATAPMAAKSKMPKAVMMVVGAK
jgi:hypothetical protein